MTKISAVLVLLIVVAGELVVDAGRLLQESKPGDGKFGAEANAIFPFFAPLPKLPPLPSILPPPVPLPPLPKLPPLPSILPPPVPLPPLPKLPTIPPIGVRFPSPPSN
ncbi:unnamed protein product [Linum trigynum]|uniref:Proline-rich protein n=1 Tax=Linum trigynum TaxID=586398 RepID=A0AAV2FWF4_9ROSI